MLSVGIWKRRGTQTFNKAPVCVYIYVYVYIYLSIKKDHIYISLSQVYVICAWKNLNIHSPPAIPPCLFNVVVWGDIMVQ